MNILELYSGLDKRLSNSFINRPKFGTCCLNGKVKLPAKKPPPPYLNYLLNTKNGLESCRFRENLWV